VEVKPTVEVKRCARAHVLTSTFGFTSGDVDGGGEEVPKSARSHLHVRFTSGDVDGGGEEVPKSARLDLLKAPRAQFSTAVRLALTASTGTDGPMADAVRGGERLAA